MGKSLYSSRLITKSDVRKVEVMDITEPGPSARRYRISVTDDSGSIVLAESGEVEISEIWLAEHDYEGRELARRLVQFRGYLPETISSKSKDVFRYPDWSRDEKLLRVGILLDTFFKSENANSLDQDWIKDSVTIRGDDISSLLSYFRQNGVIRRPPGSVPRNSIFWQTVHDWSHKLSQLLSDLRPVDGQDKREIEIKTGGVSKTRAPKQLYESQIITGDEVLRIRLVEIDYGSADLRAFRYELFDQHDTHLSRYHKEIEISRTWLATQPYDDADLYPLLVQFREMLPAWVTSEHGGLFVYPDWGRDAKLYQLGRLLKTYFSFGMNRPLSPDWIRNSIRIPLEEILSLIQFFEENGVVTGYELGSTSIVTAKDWYKRLTVLVDSLRPVDWDDEKCATVAPTPATTTITADAEIAASRPCPIVMANGKPCGRTVLKDDRCICHLDDDSKDLKELGAEVDKVLAGDNEFDFTGFRFPSAYEFPNPHRFAKRVIFKDSIFYGFLGLRETTFESRVTFASAVFEGGVDLANARFSSEFEMRYCQATTMNLTYAIFEQGMVFQKNRILASSSRDDGRVFDFHGAVFEDGPRVFVKSILPGDIALRGCNLSSSAHIHFDNLSRNDNDTFLLADEINIQRMEKAGEVVEREDYQALADCYQQLQRHMISLRNYSDAGGFHQREMEIRRTQLSGSVPNKLLYESYRLLAVWGESLTRPAFWLLGMIFAVPFITMLWMGFPGFDTDCLHRNPYGFYDAYGKDFVSNLESLFFTKGEPFVVTHFAGEMALPWGWRLALILERVFAAIMVSFVVIGVRRRFRRY